MAGGQSTIAVFPAMTSARDNAMSTDRVRGIRTSVPRPRVRMIAGLPVQRALHRGRRPSGRCGGSSRFSENPAAEALRFCEGLVLPSLFFQGFWRLAGWQDACAGFGPRAEKAPDRATLRRVGRRLAAASGGACGDRIGGVALDPDDAGAARDPGRDDRVPLAASPRRARRLGRSPASVRHVCSALLR
jgi:hypothetical protein